MGIATGRAARKRLRHTRIGGFAAGGTIAITKLARINNTVTTEGTNGFTIGIGGIHAPRWAATIARLANGDIDVTASCRAVLCTSGINIKGTSNGIVTGIGAIAVAGFCGCIHNAVTAGGGTI